MSLQMLQAVNPRPQAITARKINALWRLKE
jgi:hypothetical protein